MLRSTLNTIQSKENLVLNNIPKIYISSDIAQNLFNHQVNGIRFLYRNFKQRKSSILNDSHGTGKCFQCVAFFDALFKTSNDVHILVICQEKRYLNYWHYHIDSLLDNVSISIADNSRESQIGQSTSCIKRITIVSSSYAVANLQKFVTEQFNYLVLQDHGLELSGSSIERLKSIQAECKVVLCSKNVLDNLSYFYDILKFCDQNAPLIINDNKMKLLTKTDFKTKYGCADDQRMFNRNKIFRQQNLLKNCNDFYLRHPQNELRKQNQLIDAEEFQKNYDIWKVSAMNVSRLVADSSETASLTGLKEAQNDDDDDDDQTITSILNTASTDFDDFDTQMSPLIYSESDTDTLSDEENVKNERRKDSSDRNQRTKIVRNQEHAAVLRDKAECSSNKTTITTNTNKRLNYKQLSITINSNRIKKKVANNSNKTGIKSNVYRRISNASDIQILSEISMSPITISSSSAEGNSNIECHKQSEHEKNIGMNSPDLFSSLDSSKSELFNQKQTEDTIQKLFGAPDDCDDIDLMSNSAVDIFEITKNNVFSNVLCSANDKITPTIQANKKSNSRTERDRNCLSGLRVVLPKLDEQQVEIIRSQLQSQSRLIERKQIPNDIVDLTNSQTVDYVKIIDSNDTKNIDDLERTPERKRELTPSTRSCLKRHSINMRNSDHKKLRTPSKFGWISTRRPQQLSGTPSRRRLEKWLDNDASPKLTKIAKPKNLINEFKSKSKNRPQRKCSLLNVVTQSPNIFSDPDD